MNDKDLALVRRWWWLVVATTLLAAGAAYLVNARRDVESSAKAVLVVPAVSDADADDFLGRPSEASRLAATYAILLREDNQLLNAVASATGRPSALAVQRSLTVENVEGTSTIEVRVTGASANTTAALLDALVAAATGEEPASHLITPGSLATVSVDPPVQGSRTSDRVAVLVGALLGAAFGIVLAGIWERARPHIDTASDSLVEVPLTPRSAIVGGDAEALAQRWSELAEGDGPVALVQPGTAGTSIARRVGAEIGDLVAVLRAGHPPRELIAADVSSPGVLESASLVVLVVPPGSTVRSVATEIERLRSLSRPVRWSILAN